MTREEREEVINILYGIRADNLDLDNLYTKDKYNALDVVIKALEQEPCDDAISRQAAVEAFQMFREYESNRSNKEWVDRIETVLNQLPPITPQLKTGHWIHRKMDNECWEECSECHVKRAYPTLYCPDCGIKMVEKQERSKE